jgi:ligand-binding sensor domain-containing protein/transcriptional regulator with GAF, ATPase, and Fis domain
MPIRKFILVCLLLFIIVPSAKSKAIFRFENITAEQGLDNRNILSILRDREGFIWVGTIDGLYRYDGYTFRVFRHNPQDETSLIGNYIQNLYQDHEGILWISSPQSGLSQYHPETETFTNYLPQPDNPQKLNSNMVNMTVEDQQGILWIGTFGGGLNRYDKSNNTFSHFRHDPEDAQSLSDNRIYSVLEDSQGMIWVGTRNGGLNRLDIKSGKFKRYQHDPNNPNSISHNRVYRLFEDHNNTLWVGTRGGGLNQFNRQTESFEHYRHDPNDANSLGSDHVFAIFEDKAGTLWIGAEKGGLNRFNSNKNNFDRYQHNPQDNASQLDNDVFAITQDQIGLIWLGTSGGGISKFDPNGARFGLVQNTPNDPSSLSPGDVHVILIDNSGTRWIGTESGLNRYNKVTGQYQRYTHDPNNPQSLSDSDVRSLFEDSAGTLWIGTHTGGLNQMNRKNNSFTHYQHNVNDPHSLSDDYVRNIIEDNSGSLWMGTSNGLNRFNPTDKNFTRYTHSADRPGSISNNHIAALFLSRNNTLWVGTSDGLNRYDTQNNNFSHYQHDPDEDNSLSHNIVLVISQGPSGVFWLGTWGGGVNKFDPDKETFSRFTSEDGLSSNIVYGILNDNQGGLWLGLENGLSFLATDFSKVKNDIGRRDNCASNIGASTQAVDGRLFFGSNGYCTFYPKQVIKQSQPPNVVFTDFRLLNKIVPVNSESLRSPLSQVINHTQSLTLTHLDNVLSFEFAALHFAAPKHNQYKYILEGFNPNWIITGSENRRATFTNLPSGDYIFRVKASNNEGVWNEQGRSIALHILPAPWRTWWAYSIYVLLICTVILAFIRTQRQKVLFERSISRQLEQKVSERTAALEKSNQSITALSEISTEISATLDLNELLNKVYDRVKTLMPVDVFMIGLYSTSEQRIVFKLAIENGQCQIEKSVYMNQKDQAAVWCIEHQQPMIFNDYDEDFPRYFGDISVPKPIVGGSTKSVMYWPLIVGDKTIGVLTVQSYHKNAYNKHQQDMIQTLASTTAIALDNANAYREIEQNNRNLEQKVSERTAALEQSNQSITALSKISTEISATLELDKLLVAVYDHIKELMTVDVFSIGLYESHKLGIRFKLTIENDQHLPEFFVSMAEKNRPAVWCIDQQQPMITNDMEKDYKIYFGNNSIPVPKGGGATASIMYWPLTVGGQIIGVLTVQSFQKNAYNQHQQDMIQTLASTTAIALDNANAYRKIEDNNLNLERKVTERTAELEILGNIGKDLSASLDPEAIFSRLYQHISNIVDTHVFAIGIVEKDNIDFRLTIEANERLPSHTASLDDPSKLSAWCINKRQEVVIKHFDDISNYIKVASEATVGEKMESIVYLPLRSHEQNVTGCMTIQSPKPDAYSATQLNILRTLASYTAIALDNANAYSAVEEKNREIVATQQQLIQAEKMVSLGGLTAGVAHEINNPTNFVHVSAQNLAADLAQFQTFIFDLAGEDADEEILVNSLVKSSP